MTLDPGHAVTPPARDGKAWSRGDGTPTDEQILDMLERMASADLGEDITESEASALASDGLLYWSTDVEAWELTIDGSGLLVSALRIARLWSKVLEARIVLVEASHEQDMAYEYGTNRAEVDAAEAAHAKALDAVTAAVDAWREAGGK